MTDMLRVYKLDKTEKELDGNVVVTEETGKVLNLGSRLDHLPQKKMWPVLYLHRDMPVSSDKLGQDYSYKQLGHREDPLEKGEKFWISKLDGPGQRISIQPTAVPVAYVEISGKQYDEVCAVLEKRIDFNTGYSVHLDKLKSHINEINKQIKELEEEKDNTLKRILADSLNEEVFGRE